MIHVTSFERKRDLSPRIGSRECPACYGLGVVYIAGECGSDPTAGEKLGPAELARLGLLTPHPFPSIDDDPFAGDPWTDTEPAETFRPTWLHPTTPDRDRFGVVTDDAMGRMLAAGLVAIAAIAAGAIAWTGGAF